MTLYSVLHHRLIRIRRVMAAALVLSSVCCANEQQHVIVVLGASGTEEFGRMFNTWAEEWKAAAVAGEAASDVIGLDSDTNDRDRLQQLLSESVTKESSEPLWLVLIGHGTFDGRTAKFSLRGPDVSATELGDLLNQASRPVAVVNCTSCSAPFINALSGPNRVVITGTKDGSEIQFCRFGGFMSRAIGNAEADINRDGQTSLLEAWLFATNRTEQFYESEGRLATEHSLLDDTGDGKGTRADVFEGVRIKENVKNKDALDGRLAGRWHLVRSEDEKKLSPEQRATRDQLEQDLETLRARRDRFSEEDYLKELESILLPLARLYDDGQPTP